MLTVVDAGDANIIPAWIDRAHALIYRKVLEVASTGAIPIVLGGDHSITWPSATAVAEVRRPGSIGIVHFDAHADTAADDWGVLAGHGTPMRRLIESGAVKGRNFVQVGLRGYWPPVETFEWMKEQGLRWHFMREIEERGAEAVIAQAIDEALDGPDYIYLSLDIDVIDPGHGARDRHARAGRHAHPRGAPGHPPDRRGGRPRGHGHRRGVAAVRPRRDDGDGRQPRRARGDQRARRPARGGQAGSLGRARAPRRPLPGGPARAPRPPGLTAADARPSRSGDRRGARPPVRPRPRRRPGRPRPLSRPGRPGGRPDPRARRRAAAGWPSRWPRPATASRASTSIAPCSIALARAPGRGAAPAADRLTLVEADLVGLALPEAGGFGLAFIALNSLLVLPTRAAQRAALRTLADHLAPGGLAVVDVWLPDAEDLARFDGRISLEWPRLDPETGAIVTKAASAQHDAAVRDGHPDHDLRGGRPGRAARALGPARPPPPRVGRRAARVRRGRRAASWRRWPATTTWGRSARAASARS